MGKSTIPTTQKQGRLAPVVIAEHLEHRVAEFQSRSALTCGGQQQRNNANAVRRFLAAGEIEQLNQITRGGVQDYLLGLLRRGRNPKTIRNVAGSLSRFSRFLVEEGVLVGNPCDGIRLPRIEIVPPRFLDRHDYRRTLVVAAQNHIFPEVSVALLTGLRMSELQRLAWEDIDFDRNQVLVRHSKSRRFRCIPLCKEAAKVLRYQHRRTGNRKHVFPGADWAGRSGMRKRQWWVEAMYPLQKAVAEFRKTPKGSPGRGWHLLRHTFASRLAQAGVSIYKLSKWLGHAQVSTTQMYAHLAPGFDEDIEKVSAGRRVLT